MGRVAFAGFFWVVGLVGVLAGREISGVGGWIPVAAALIVIVLATGALAVDTRTLVLSKRSGIATPVGGPVKPGSLEELEGVSNDDVHGSFVAWGYVGVVMAFYFIFGPAIAMTLSVIFFVRFYAHSNVLRGILVGVGLGLVTHYGITFAELQAYPGLLFDR